IWMPDWRFMEVPFRIWLMRAIGAFITGRFIFFIPLVLDRGLGAMKAMEAAWSLSAGLGLLMPLFSLAVVFLSLLSAKVYNIPSLYLTPLNTLILCSLYDQALIHFPGALAPSSQEPA